MKNKDKRLLVVKLKTNELNYTNGKLYHQSEYRINVQFTNLNNSCLIIPLGHSKQKVSVISKG